MKFHVIPLIYSANEQFKNTIRFAVERVYGKMLWVKDGEVS